MDISTKFLILSLIVLLNTSQLTHRQIIVFSNELWFSFISMAIREFVNVLGLAH